MYFRRSQRTRILAAAVGVVATSSAHALVQPAFRIIDLGTLGGATSEALGINNNGQVVGWSKTAANVNRAFLTAPNSPINLATDMVPLMTGGTFNFGYAVNSTGQVAGDGNSSNGQRAYRSTGGVSTSLGTLGGTWSYSYGINDAGQAVGGAALSKQGQNFPTHAYIYSGSTMFDLGTFGGSDSYANAINAGGKVVGYAQLGDANISEHAFLWTPTTPNGTSGSKIDLGTLGGNYSYAYGINAAGTIVGGAGIASDAEYHAFMRPAAGGPLADLGTLGGTNSEARGINAAGVVVGNAEDASFALRAFIDVNNTMYNLNNLIPAGSGWTLNKAMAINDNWQIAGIGTNSAGQSHGYLLTAIPTWKTDGAANWSSQSNWFGPVPNAVSAEAQLTGAITTARAVALDVPVTLGTLVLDNVNAYTLAGSSTLTMSSAGAGIDVKSGSHAIATPVSLAGNVSFNVEQAASALNLTGATTSAGSGAITKIGAGALLVGNVSASSGVLVNSGTLALNPGAALLGTPTISVASGAHFDVSGTSFSTPAGTTLGGNGIVHGNYSHGAGTISPGASPGTITFANDLNLTGGGTLLLDLSTSNTTVGGGVNDLIIVNGNLAITGPTTIKTSVPIGSLTVGSYTLITYSGNLSGSEANLSMDGVVPNMRRVFSFSNTGATNGAVMLSVAGAPPQYIVWSGGNGNNNWDLTTTPNFDSGTNQFFNADSVTFNDTSANVSVNLVGDLVPNAVTVGSNTSNYIFSGTGRISGAGTTVTKSGNSTLVIANSATNDYTGDTNINAGTLQVGTGGTTGNLGSAGSILLAAGSTLSFNRSDALTVGNVLPTVGGSNGRLVQSGSGTTILTANSPFNGIVDVNAGTLQLGTGGSSGMLAPSNYNIAAGGAIAFNRSDSVIVSAGIIGSGSLWQTGSGTLIILNNNASYSGAVSVSAGAVQVGNGGASGSPGTGPIVIAGGSTIVFNRTGTIAVFGSISGAGSVVQTNSGGTLALSGANSYDGQTQVLAGTLSVASATALGSTIGGTIVAPGATLLLSNATVSGESLTLSQSALVAGTGVNAWGGAVAIDGATNLVANSALTVNGNVSLIGSPQPAGSLTLRGANAGTIGGVVNIGTYALNKVDVGSWSIASPGNIWGATNISQGALGLAASNALPTATTITLGQTGTSATLDLGGFNQQVAGLATAGNGGTITNSSATADSNLIYLSASTSTFAGVISDGATRSVGLNVNGGTIVLTGASSYSGATNINSGALRVGNAGATGSIGTGPINVSGGASIIFNRSTALSAANAISGSGNVVQLGTSTLTLSGASSFDGQTLVNSGTLSVASNNALGSSVGGTVVAPGAAISLAGAAIASEPLRLDQGSLLANSGANVWGGAISINGSTTFAANAALAVSGNVSLVASPLAAGTLTLRGTNAGTLSNNASIGTYAVNKTDAGSWTVASTGNTWGATIVGQGKLLLGADNALPTTTIVTLGQTGAAGTVDLNGFSQQLTGLATAGSGGTITNGSTTGDSTLTYIGLASTSFAGVIANGAARGVALTVSAGTLVLNGANTYGGNTTINSMGALQIGSGGTAGTLGAGAINNDGVLIFNRSDARTFANAIGGAGEVRKIGGGTITLNGANTYSGPTNVLSGMLIVTNSASLGAVPGSAVNIASGASLDLAGDSIGNDLNFGAKSFVIAGAGVGGAGALVNSGSLSQQNALGNVALSADATIGGASRLDIGATLDLANRTLTKAGSNQISLAGTNVSDGNIVVGGGTLSIEGAANIPDNGSGKTLTFNANTVAQFVANTGVVTRPMVINGAGVQFGNAATGASDLATVGSSIMLKADLTFSMLGGNISAPLLLTGGISESGGSRSVTKTSPTLLTFAGDSTYSGTTTISAGTLQIGNGGVSGSLGSGPVVNNANLVFAGADSSSVSNDVSGSGNVVHAGAGTTLLSGSLSYNGSTTVSAGTLRLGRSLTTSPTVNILNTSRLELTGGADKVLATQNLNIDTSAVLDLNDNDAIVDYSGTSLLATIQSQISSGYNGGAWSGWGITSTAAANNNAIAGIFRTALGYGESSAVFTTFPAVFAGQIVDADAVLIRYTYCGDANLDGAVDTIDFNLLAAGFGGTSKSWTQADFSYDGAVDTVDFNLLAANFGQVLAAPTTAPIGQPVPEPSTFVLWTSIFGAQLIRRRRGRRSVCNSSDVA